MVFCRFGFVSKKEDSRIREDSSTVEGYKRRFLVGFQKGRSGLQKTCS